MPPPIRGVSGAVARATRPEPIAGGRVPNAFERRTRMLLPPADNRTIWRRVTVLAWSAGTAFSPSASICDDPQVAIQRGVGRAGNAWSARAPPTASIANTIAAGHRFIMPLPLFLFLLSLT
jgi:hypothetical protein